MNRSCQVAAGVFGLLGALGAAEPAKKAEAGRPVLAEESEAFGGKTLDLSGRESRPLPREDQGVVRLRGSVADASTPERPETDIW
jgi:hypothetical protein